MNITYLTSGQAARRLGISTRTLGRAVQRGEISPTMRTPGGRLRFLARDVEAYARCLASPGPQDRRASTTSDMPQEPPDAARYQLVTSLTSDYAYCFAVLPDGTRMLEWVSAAFERITGYTPEDIRTEAVQFRLIHPEDLSIAQQRTQALLAGRPATCEFRIVTKDQQTRWVRDCARPLWDAEQGRVVTIIGAAQDISMQRQVEQQAQRGQAAAEELARLRQDQAEEAEAMAQVSAALAGSLESTELYRIILEQATRLLPLDTSCVFLIQDDWVVVAATWGEPNPPVGTRAFRMDDRLRERWPKAGDPPLYSSDMRLVAGRTPRNPWTGAHEVRSIITVPLAIDGELVGVFDVASTKPNFYTERHIRIAAAFGDRVTQALRNARLYAAEQERSRVAEELARLRQEQMGEAEALAEVSAALASALDPGTLYQIILEQSARVLPFDYAEIVLYQEGWVVIAACFGKPTVSSQMRLFPIDTTTSFWQALASGRTQYMADTADVPEWQDFPPWIGPYRIRSSIIAPLLVNGVLLGSFAVSSYTPHFYTPHHIQIASVFGERATQAMRNARLYAAEQERARSAENLARLRSDFVASVSHELRTPLTAIVGYAEILQHRWTQIDDAHKLDQVGKIVTAANRQQRMVEDLLLLTRLEQGQIVPRLNTVQLARLVRQAADEVRSSYQCQQIMLEGPTTLVVHVDAGRTVQVLVNLLDNAAKYSPEGSTVLVSWECEGSMAVVRVRDQGPGISDQGRSLLFTRFGRIPGSRIRAGRVGTGLGLHISRTLAEAMGGDLDLEATGTAGSTFRLRLPTPPASPDVGDFVCPYDTGG